MTSDASRQPETQPPACQACGRRDPAHPAKLRYLTHPDGGSVATAWHCDACRRAIL